MPGETNAHLQILFEAVNVNFQASRMEGSDYGRDVRGLHTRSGNLRSLGWSWVRAYRFRGETTGKEKPFKRRSSHPLIALTISAVFPRLNRVLTT